MVFNWSENSITQDLLNDWLYSSNRDEGFLLKTENFLEELKQDWIANEEYLLLKDLLKQNQADLVYRYLDLQIHLRMSEDKDHLHVALELEKELENYVRRPQKSRLQREIALRSMENVIGNWITSFGLSPLPIFLQVYETDLCRRLRRSIENLLKEESYKIGVESRLFIKDVLSKSDDSLEYLHLICMSLEQILLWEEPLKEILYTIETHPRNTDCDPENLVMQLEHFEKGISNFYKQFGKVLQNIIAPSFSEFSKAYIIGKFRKDFQKINDAYASLKDVLLNQHLPVHLCCLCHFGEENLSQFWPLKNDILQLHKNFFLEKKAHHNPPSLLIFTCGGGKGHLSVAKAMSEYGYGSYHIQIVNTLEDTLASTDVFKKMLFDYSQEKLYNHLLKNEEFEWLKLITSIGPFFIMMQQESIEKQIQLEILKYNPDILISCFPIMNSMFLNVAKEFNLPLLMVTTDLDTELFTRGMHSRSCDLEYPHWKMTLAYDDIEMRSIIEKRIPSNKIHISGFPVRPAFNQPINEEENTKIKKEFLIEKNQCVILVTIGGVAGCATEKYAEILASLNNADLIEITETSEKEIQVLCLCGDQSIQENRAMRIRINMLTPKCQKIKIRAIGAVEMISPLMSIADILITKPGGCTTNEAIAKGLPMIFHAPFALMDWEVFNMEFCLKYEIGFRFKPQSNNVNFFQDGLLKNKQRLIPLLNKALKRKKNFPQSFIKRKDFGKEFHYLIETLLHSKSLS